MKLHLLPYRFGMVKTFSWKVRIEAWQNKTIVSLQHAKQYLNKPHRAKVTIAAKCRCKGTNQSEENHIQTTHN